MRWEERDKESQQKITVVRGRNSKDTRPSMRVHHVPAVFANTQGSYATRVCVRALPDDLRVLPVLALAVPPLAVHDGGVHVGGGEGVGLIQQGDDAQQDGPWGEETGTRVHRHAVCSPRGTQSSDRSRAVHTVRIRAHLEDGSKTHNDLGSGKKS